MKQKKDGLPHRNGIFTVHIVSLSLTVVLSLTTYFIAVFSGLFNEKPALFAAFTVSEAAIAAILATLLFFTFKRRNRGGFSVEPDIALNKAGHAENSSESVKMSSLISIIENIESNEPFYDILTFIYNSFSDFIPYSHIGVALIDNDYGTIRAAYAVSSAVHSRLAKQITGYKTDLSETSLEKVIISGMPRVINDLDKYLCGKSVHSYNRILLENGIKSSITFPLIKNDIPIGIIFFSSDQKNVYRIEHIDFLQTIANSIMLSLEKNLLLDEMVVSSSLALATLAEERDNETGGHLDRMQRYSVLLAEQLMRSGNSCFEAIGTDYLGALELFSPLHDIGKVAIGDSILLKPGKLTAEEFNVMKTHTTYGGKVLRLADENVRKEGRSVFGMGIEITEGHHERWDGTGYPCGRIGEMIPLSARIVAVADVLDALTSKRPYKEPFGFEESAQMIIKESGTHFDPRIIEVFKSSLPVFKKVYQELNGL